jgi:hypothetical protein
VSEKEKRAKQTIDRSIDRTSSATKDEDNLSLSLSLSFCCHTPKEGPGLLESLVVIKKEGSRLADESFGWTFFFGRAQNARTKRE